MMFRDVSFSKIVSVTQITAAAYLNELKTKSRFSTYMKLLRMSVRLRFCNLQQKSRQFNAAFWVLGGTLFPPMSNQEFAANSKSAQAIFREKTGETRNEEYGWREVYITRLPYPIPPCIHGNCCLKMKEMLIYLQILVSGNGLFVVKGGSF